LENPWNAAFSGRQPIELAECGESFGDQAGDTGSAAVMSSSPTGGNVTRRSVSELFGVIIVAGIGAIWALGLLSLLFTLPHDFISPADPASDTLKSDRAIDRVVR